MKTVYLASKMLIEYERAEDADFLVGVAVTNQCYNALKRNGYTLGEAERSKLAENWPIGGFTKAKAYGGVSGFTYKELRKFLAGSLLTAAEVRAL